jgi:F0F1-type ATP synthase assembly protein I
MTVVPQQPPESARGLAAGLTFAVTVALFALGGLWLDGKLGTQPWFVLLGVLLGLVGGTIHLLRVLAPSALPFGRRRPPTRQHNQDKRPPDPMRPPPQ